MAFNLRKQAQSHGNMEQMLVEKNKDNGTDAVVNEAPGITDMQLDKNVRKNKDNNVPFNKQLEASRVGGDSQKTI